MRQKIITLIVMILCIVATFFPTSTQADFIDDWLASKTETSPGYFEGQKRGYATGGTFSARWSMNNDHVFSAESPRFKGGCGGIDLFMGGFSFMNADYLVQKMQRILQAAPAMAFDLALNTLCTQCSTIMKAMEEIANKLNGLQMADCHDAKVLTATIASPFTSNSKLRDEAQKSFSITSGIKDLYRTITGEIQANDGKPTISDESPMYSGCPQAVKDLFFTQSSSVFSAVATKRGIPASHVLLARGLIGDIQFEPITDSSGANLYKLYPVNPCPENDTNGIQNFLNGTAYVRPLDTPDATCIPSADSNADIKTWVRNQLQNVYDNLRTKGTLTTDNEAFIQTVPLVYHNLAVAVVTKQSGQILSEMSEFAAKAYAFRLINDLYSQAFYNIRLAQSALAKQADSPKNDCHISTIEADIGQLRVLDERMQRTLAILQQDYQKYLQEHSTLLNVGRRYSDFTDISRDRLSKAYSQTFVNRVMSGL